VRFPASRHTRRRVARRRGADDVGAELAKGHMGGHRAGQSLSCNHLTTRLMRLQDKRAGHRHLSTK